MDRLRLALAALVASLALAACTSRAPDATTDAAVRPHVALDARGSELRSAFNADRGHVRVVVIVAPT